MNFDGYDIYTYLDADKIRVGTDGYFANDFDDLIEHIKRKDKEFYGTVTEIRPIGLIDRFVINGNNFVLFYPIEEHVKKEK